MGVNKFFVFKEDGTLARLKSSISRFLDNDPPVNDDKVNIRAAISVPASAEGLTPANNLSDVNSAATSRDNIEVPSDAELLQGIAPRQTLPSIETNGVNSYLEVADNDVLTPASGSDDSPISIVLELLCDDITAATTLPIVGKYGTTAANREWWVYVYGGSIFFEVTDTSGNAASRTWDISEIDELASAICITYPGAGPNRSTSFANAMNGAKCYLNNKELTATATTNNASYGGASNTSQALWIGRCSDTYSAFHYLRVRIYNREISSSEFYRASKGFDNPRDLYGGSNVYSGDSVSFTSGLGNWTEEGSTSITVTQSGGEMIITNTASSTGTRGARNIVDAITENRRYRLKFKCRTSSGTGQSIQIGAFNSSAAIVAQKNMGDGVAATGGQYFYSFTPGGTFTTHEIEFVLPGNGTDYILINLNNTGSGEVYNFDDILLTQVGLVLDLKSENFNNAAGVWNDATTNSLDATNNNATQHAPRKHIKASSLDLTGIPTSPAGLSSGEVYSNSGVLNIV